MTEPVRVLHVMGKMGAGGVEAFVMNHYRRIDRGRVQFDFMIDDDSTVVPRDEIEALGGRIAFVPDYKRLSAYLPSVQALLREWRPRIVHAHLNALSVIPLLGAKRAGVPVRIAHSHSTAAPGELVKNAAKAVLRPLSKTAPTHFAACSKHAAAWLFGERLVRQERVRIVRNAIDLPRFAPDLAVRHRLRTELDIADDSHVVGCVGRLSAQKNQLFLLDVFSRLLTTYPSAVLVLVGDGDLRGAVETKVARLGIAGSVRLLGVRADVADLYQVMDVLAMPSTYEGLGMVAIEAEASGLSVVASDRVPTEADVTGLITFLPLEASIDSWVRALKASFPDRRDRTAELAAAGYDIVRGAVMLGEWYRSMEG